MARNRERIRSNKRSKKESRHSKQGRSKHSKRNRSKSAFTYTPRSAASVKKRADQYGTNSDYFIKDEFKIFRPKESNHIRILPPTWDDAEHFAFDAFVNYSIGADQSSFCSLSQMQDEDDPIAEERKRAEKDGDLEYAESLKPTKRPTCFVLDRNSPDDGVMVYPMPWTLDRDIASLMIHARTGEVIPIDDLEEGYDVYFDKTGKGMRTKYKGVQIDRDSSIALDDDDELDELIEWLEDHPLPEVFEFKDYDYLEKVFAGHVHKPEDEDEDEDEDEYTWKEIHDMDEDEVEEVIDREDLDLDIDDFANDEQNFLDEMCEELGIDKPKKKKSRRKEKRSGRGKLRSMRDKRKASDDEDNDERASEGKRKSKRRRR